MTNVSNKSCDKTCGSVSMSYTAVSNKATNATLAQIASCLAQAKKVAICGHVSPDGDCLGSTLALTWGLRELGVKVTPLIARDEPIDFGLRFLPGADELVPAEYFTESVDVFVTVDVPTRSRLGDAAAQLHVQAPHTITVDHHESNEPLSLQSYVDPDAPSCSLLIWYLLSELGVMRSRDMATCAYTGLNTDTGRFSFQNATAQAFQAASEMIDAGVEPAYVAEQVYQNRSRASLRLEAYALEHVQYYHEGAFVLSYLSEADFRNAGAHKPDAEPLIDLLRSVRGVKVACMLREQGGVVRGSMRAKDDTNVAEIAARFGGGGHKAAAGFTFHGSLGAARARMESIFFELNAGGRADASK